MLGYRLWLAVVALGTLSWACSCGGDDDGGGAAADASATPDGSAPADASTPDARGGDGDASAGEPDASSSQTCNPAFVLPAANFGTLVDRHELQATCAPAGAGAENVYELPAPVLSRLTIDVVGLGVSLPPTVSVRAGDCADPSTELQCFAGGGSQSIEDLLPGPYYLIVEGAVGDAFALDVGGTVPLGSPCDLSSARYLCEAGSGCGIDGVCAVHTCSDGIDNDGNGRTDFPDDPGCGWAGGDTEDAGCPAPGCPACSNGIDDDQDGRVDYPEDTDCMFAAQGTEESIACFNDLDDDGDGMIDAVDPGCLGRSASEVDSCPDGPGCPACADRIDNDRDGRIDWPDEDGCLDHGSTSEDDACPGGGACAGCANGRDDDLDGVADYPEDPDCAVASRFERVDCLESDALIPVTGPVMTGTTVGATHDRTLEVLNACHSAEEGGNSPDVVLWLAVPGRLNFLQVDSSGSDFDEIVGIAETSCESIDQCEESTLQTQVTAFSLGPDAYIHVDGTAGDSGNYELLIEGEITAGEACDPSQIDSGLLHCEPPTLCVTGNCQ
jgi:hypothetical protein